MPLDDKNERALWLADKLVGDYGSEAAQLLRWFASAPSAIVPPGIVELVQMIDKMEAEGNGWNPILHPTRTNEAEKEFRSTVVSNWRAIRKYIPVARSDGEGA